ncbi:MAG: hypothetical protein LBT92_00305 [Rickettsiales bacterium]|nr:hypothetical protein [Rickettsiales bacterium]
MKEILDKIRHHIEQHIENTVNPALERAGKDKLEIPGDDFFFGSSKLPEPGGTDSNTRENQDDDFTEQDEAFIEFDPSTLEIIDPDNLDGKILGLYPPPGISGRQKAPTSQRDRKVEGPSAAEPGPLSEDEINALLAGLAGDEAPDNPQLTSKDTGGLTMEGDRPQTGESDLPLGDDESGDPDGNDGEDDDENVLPDGNQSPPLQDEEQAVRLRSYGADFDTFAFDPRTGDNAQAKSNRRQVNQIRLSAMRAAGLDSGTDDIAGMDDQQLAEAIADGEKKMKSAANRRKFDKKFVEGLSAVGEFENLSPRQLISLYENKRATREIKDQTLRRMARLADEASEESSLENFKNFADYTNAGSVAEGYLDMFDFMDKHKKEFGNISIAKVPAARANMNDYIGDWDDRHNLGGIKREKKEKDRQKVEKELQKRAKGIISTLETIGVADLGEARRLLANLKITKNGDPLDLADAAPFKDEILAIAKGELLDDFVAGTQNYDGDTVKDALEDKVREVLWRTEVADKVGQGLLEKPDLFTNAEYMRNYISELGAGGKEIQAPAINEAWRFRLQERLNVIERIGKRLGNDKAQVLETMYEDVRREDERRGGGKKERFADATQDQYNKNFKRQLVRTGLTSAGMGFAFNIIRHINWPFPGAGMIAVGVLSTGLAIANLKRHHDQWKAVQRKKGVENPRFLDYLKNPENLLTIGVSVVSIFAAVTGVGAAAEKAGAAIKVVNKVARFMAIAGVALKGLIGGLMRIGAAIKDAKKNNKSVRTAVLVASGQTIAAGAVPLAAGLAGSWLAGEIVDGINEHTGFKLFKRKETWIEREKDKWVEDEPKKITQRDYGDEDVEFAKRRLGGEGTVEVVGGRHVPGGTMPRPHGNFDDFDHPQNLGGHVRQDWTTASENATAQENIASSALIGDADGQFLPSQGNEAVMQYKLEVFTRLNEGNPEVRLASGASVNTIDLLEKLTHTKGYAMTADETAVLDRINYLVAERGHMIGDEYNPVDQTLARWRTVGVNSFEAGHPDGVKAIPGEIPQGHWEPGKEIEHSKWVSNEMPFLEALGIALPFVFPIRDKVLQFKKGVKALLDMTKKKKGRFIGGRVGGQRTPTGLPGRTNLRGA